MRAGAQVTEKAKVVQDPETDESEVEVSESESEYM